MKEVPYRGATTVLLAGGGNGTPEVDADEGEAAVTGAAEAGAEVIIVKKKQKQQCLEKKSKG